MNISREWCDTVNYWIRRLRMADGGSFLLPTGPPNALIPQRFALFELKGDLTPGASVDAYFRREVDSSGFAVSDWTTLVNSSQTSKVRDINGNLRAFGRDTVTGYYSAGHGAYCLAMHDDIYGSDTMATDKWLIYSMQPLAGMIKVGIGTGCVSASATFTPTSLAVMDRGQDPGFNGNHYPTIKNYSSAIGNSGAGTTGIICAWDESATQYVVIDAPCAVGC